jgi:hypothetical protein
MTMSPGKRPHLRPALLVLALGAFALGFAARRYAAAAEISVWPVIVEHLVLALGVVVAWAALAIVPGWRPLAARLTWLCWALAILSGWSAATFLRAVPEARRFSAELHRTIGRDVDPAGIDTVSSPALRPALDALRSATDTLERLSDAYARVTEACETREWLLPERLATRAQLLEDRACSARLVAAGGAALDYYPRYRAHLRDAFAQLQGPHRHLGRSAAAGLEPAVVQAEELFRSNVEVAARYRRVFDVLLRYWGAFQPTATGMTFRSAAAESALSRELSELAGLLERHETLSARVRALEGMAPARH